MSAPPGDAPRRIAVIASASGNGKTTLARALAARLGVRCVELDALVHGRGWSELPDEDLRRLVEPLVALEGWVIDGVYRSKLGDLVLAAADIVVWLDLPVRVWLPRLVRRTALRIARREELWNGNRETLRGALLGRDALLSYSVRAHFDRRRRYPAELAAYPVVRLRTPREVEQFLAGTRCGERAGGSHPAADGALMSHATDHAPEPRESSRAERERHASDETDVYERQDAMRARLSHVFASPNTLWAQGRFDELVHDAARGARVLELGCSIGAYGEALVRDGAAFVLGVDLSERLIAEARSRAVPGRLEFVLGDASAPVAGSFDLVVGRAILHHLDWREVVPRLYADNLAPGGTMAFWEPLGSNLLLRAYRRAARGLHTPDEAPFMRDDVRWLRRRFDLELLPVNYVTLPLGVLSSYVLPRPDNGLLRLADRIDRRLGHVRPLAPGFRNAVLIIRKPRAAARASASASRST